MELKIIQMSNAVGTERISKVVGYKIKKGDSRESTPNLPQRVVIIGEANTANQPSLDTTQKDITTTQKAGQLYGFGSPIYQVMRILRPVTGRWNRWNTYYCNGAR